VIRYPGDIGRAAIPVLCLILAFLTLGANSAGATWLGEERLTNDPSASLTPPNNAWCVAFDSAGGINVVWTDYRNGITGVYHKSFGPAWSTDSIISLPTYVAHDPSVAGDGVGHPHVVWTDYRHSNSEIYYRAYDGSAWGASERISSSSSSSLNPSVAAGDSGDIHIAWHDYRDYSWEIYYRTFDGAAWSPEQRLTNSSGNSLYASIAVGPGGTVHITWQDSRDGNNEIYYKQFDGAWSADERLTSDAGSSEQPSIAVDSDGDAHVVWSDDRDGAVEIYHKVCVSGIWGADERLTYEPATSAVPSVAADAGAGIHVVWRDERDGSQEIYYRGYDGLTWGTESRMSSDGGASKHPSIACGPDGRMAMVWQDDRDGDSEIYARRFLPGPFPPPVIASITPSQAHTGSVVAITDLAGEDFLLGASVKLQVAGESDIVASSVVVESDHKITCVFDLAGAADGIWDVVVENPDGQSDTLVQAFTVWPWSYVAVTSVIPDGGYPGQQIDGLEIWGTGFRTSARAWLTKIGDAPMLTTNVVVHSLFRITCDISLREAQTGLWDVVVQNTDLEQGILEEGFLLAYLNAPEIMSIDPFEGVAGTRVTITYLAGENFHELASVWLQNSEDIVINGENVVVESPQKITCEFDLSEIIWGYLDLVVMHPDGLKDTLASGFRIIPGEWSNDLRLTDALGGSHLSKGNARCIAADGLGNLHAVWFDERHGDSEIYYRMHDGISWGAEERITTAANESENPAIAIDSNNTVYLFWADRMRGDWEIYYISRDLSGWSSIECLTDAQSLVNNPSVSTDSNNDLHVVWQALHYSGAYQIIYQRTQYSAWLPPDTLSLSYADHKYPAIAIDGYGIIHVVSRESPSSDECIRYTKSDGSTWEPPISIVCREDAGAPSLCADADGKLHLAFHDKRFDNFEVFYKHFDGSVWQPAVRLSDAPAKSLQPSLVSTGTGEVTVVWSDERDGDYTYEIYSKHFDGASWGPESRLTYAPGTSCYPSAAIDMAGTLQVIWSDDRDGNFEIYHKTRGENAAAGVGDEEPAGPVAGPLQIHPNPFRDAVEIRLSRGAGRHTTVSIYDISGRLVWKRRIGPEPADRTGIVWDGRSLDGKRVAPGVYVVQLTAGDQTALAKIVMLR